MHAHPAATSTNSHPRTHKTLFMTLPRPPSPPRPPLARPQTCAQSGPGAHPPTRWRNRRPSTAGGRWGPVLVMDQKGRGWKRKMVVRGSAASLILRGGGTLPGQPRPSPPPCLTRRTCGHGPPTHTPRARRVPQLTTASITGAPPSTPPRPAVGRRTDAPLRRTSVIVRRAGWRPRRGMDVKECACVCEKCRLLLCRGLPHQQRTLLLASALCFFAVSPTSLFVWWRAELLLPAPLPQTYIRTHTRPCACSDSSSTRTHIRATRRRPLPPRSLNLPLNAACRRRRAGPGWCRLLLRAGWRGRTRPVRGTVSHVEQLPGEWRAARIDGCPGAPGAKRGRTPRTAEKKKKKTSAPNAPHPRLPSARPITHTATPCLHVGHRPPSSA